MLFISLQLISDGPSIFDESTVCQWQNNDSSKDQLRISSTCCKRLHCAGPLWDFRRHECNYDGQWLAARHYWKNIKASMWLNGECFFSHLHDVIEGIGSSVFDDMLKMSKADMLKMSKAIHFCFSWKKLSSQHAGLNLNLWGRHWKVTDRIWNVSGTDDDKPTSHFFHLWFVSTLTRNM